MSRLSKRHLDLLQTKLEEASDCGYAYISYNFLKGMFRTPRLTPSVYREILSTWEELLEHWENDKILKPAERNAPLFVGEVHDGLALVWGQGLTASDDSWLKDIRHSDWADIDSEAKAA